MTVSENDFCTLAAIVTAEREDLPAQGLPPSLQPGLQLPGPDRGPAERGEDRGLLLGPAVAVDRHVRRRVPAAGIKHELQLCLPEPPGPDQVG
jgi:hypothetical protein